jgi:hypothetical protein
MNVVVGRPNTEIADSNLAWDMDICSLMCDFRASYDSL